MYNFILNPVAGKGRALKAMKALERYLSERNIEYAVHMTGYPCHAIELSEKLSRGGCENIVAVGGDGTVNEVLNGLADPKSCKMGIVPCGTGNDFSAFIGLSKKPVEALKTILTGEARPTDYLTLGGRRVMNITGMGMDVDVLERCLHMKLVKGKLQYLLALIRTLIRLKFYDFEISVDGGEPVKKSVLIIAACNGKYFGGGIPISPQSAVSDNFQNVVVVHKIKKRKSPGALIGLLRGRILRYDFVEQILCGRVSVRPVGTAETTVNIDGEIYKNIPFDCELVKDGLLLYR
jgi:YegS/Rv2252/BmrU family lipid kinase